jgi:hypothetical protein
MIDNPRAAACSLGFGSPEDLGAGRHAEEHVPSFIRHERVADEPRRAGAGPSTAPVIRSAASTSRSSV